jgi:hypothetical protein
MDSDNPRRDYCPDCGYEFYYGDAHAANPEARISREINPGRSKPDEPTQLSWPASSGFNDDDGGSSW